MAKAKAEVAILVFPLVDRCSPARYRSGCFSLDLQKRFRSRFREHQLLTDRTVFAPISVSLSSPK